MIENDNKQLLTKPVAMMTGEDLVSLISHVVAGLAPAPAQNASVPTVVYGMQGIAGALGCSVPTASRIKATKVLDGAIIQHGRTIIMDVPKAFELLKAAGGMKRVQQMAKGMAEGNMSPNDCGHGE
ncbi:MAG: DUF3853 family protein [Bacteroidales bacterium]|nr:DUF3853 family protein [Bacteroidales bacterium]